MDTIILDKQMSFAIHPQVFKALQGLAVGLARSRLEASGVPDLTDNSTGTAGTSLADVPIPASAFDASAAGGTQLTALNTSIGKIENAGRVLVNSFNKVRAIVGLPLLTAANGTEAAANTIPAQDTSATAASGTSSVDFESAIAAMKVAAGNVGILAHGLSQIRAAIGEPAVVSSAYRGHFTSLALADIPTVVAATDGSSSVATAAATSFLAAVANNLATLAALWNQMFNQGSFSTLTDSTGGTSSTGLVANASPAPANGAATTSAPKAGFDTQLAAINDGFGELVSTMNVLRNFYDLAPYTDSTGVTANGTLSAVSNSLTAVDGSTGTSAVDEVTALARMVTVKNNMSSLAVGINDLVGFVGVPSLTDALGGTASTTIAAVAATGTGVGGATGTPTLLNADVDTWLGHARDNLATLAAKLNAIIGAAEVSMKPLTVVAG